MIVTASLCSFGQQATTHTRTSDANYIIIGRSKQPYKTLQKVNACIPNSPARLYSLVLTLSALTLSKPPRFISIARRTLCHITTEQMGSFISNWQNIRPSLHPMEDSKRNKKSPCSFVDQERLSASAGCEKLNFASLNQKNNKWARPPYSYTSRQWPGQCDSEEDYAQQK